MPTEKDSVGEDTAIDKLHRISMLEVGPSEAVTIIYETYQKVRAEELYGVLILAVWELLVTRTYGQEMRRWYDVMRRAAALLCTKHPEWEQRILVLSDLVLMSARFGETTLRDENGQLVWYASDILSALRQKGGRASFEEVVAITGIAASNLVGLVSTMSALGLTARIGYGQKMTLSTPEHQPCKEKQS